MRSALAPAPLACAVAVIRCATRVTLYAKTRTQGVGHADGVSVQLLLLLSRHRTETKILFRDGTSSEGHATPIGGAILQRTKGMAQCCTLKQILREITPT